LITNILDQVDPISRHATPQDYLIRPDQAVPWMIQENQFGATFDFNQNMQMAAIGAMPDPQQAGMLNMQMMQAGMAGGGGGGSSVNYAQIAQALAGAYGSYKASAGTSGGGMNASYATQPNQQYYNPSTGVYSSPTFSGSGKGISQRPPGL
jgi:hypothetical protein